MNKLAVTKLVITAIVGSGTTKIVGAIIKNNITPERVIDKVTVLSSSVVLGGMAADASRKYTDAKIDEIANWYVTTVQKKFVSE